MVQQKIGQKKKANSLRRDSVKNGIEIVEEITESSLSPLHLTENSFIASISPDNNISHSYKPYIYVETRGGVKKNKSMPTGFEVVLFFLSGCFLCTLFILTIVLFSLGVTN